MELRQLLINLALKLTLNLFPSLYQANTGLIMLRWRPTSYQLKTTHLAAQPGEKQYLRFFLIQLDLRRRHFLLPQHLQDRNSSV